MTNDINAAYVQDQVVLITGVAGTIGKSLAQQLTKQGPRLVLGLDNNETELTFLQQTFGDKYLPVLCDIRDVDQLCNACKGVDIVFHAAAMKQVSAAEYNPMECIKTNVDGAQNVINGCLSNNVLKIIALSTDKAANPVNLYGASKLASDKLFVAANNMVGKSKTRFSVCEIALSESLIFLRKINHLRKRGNAFKIPYKTCGI